LTLAIGEVMLELAGIDGGRDRLQGAIEDGSALQKLIDVAIAHGGDPAVIEDTTLLATAPREGVITAPEDGYVTSCDALAVGIAATRLGAGRERKEDTIDPGVGITIEAKIGDRVSAGDALAKVRYRDESRWEAQRGPLAAAWAVGGRPEDPPPLILERIP
jgi:thymidine phosphorylase